MTPDTILRWHRRRIATKWRQHAVDHYIVDYNAERPHQGLGNELIGHLPAAGGGDVTVSERLGGLLKHYLQAA